MREEPASSDSYHKPASSSHTLSSLASHGSASGSSHEGGGGDARYAATLGADGGKIARVRRAAIPTKPMTEQEKVCVCARACGARLCVFVCIFVHVRV